MSKLVNTPTRVPIGQLTEFVVSMERWRGGDYELVGHVITVKPGTCVSTWRNAMHKILFDECALDDGESFATVEEASKWLREHFGTDDSCEIETFGPISPDTKVGVVL
jgi:hypothetical protein